MWPDVCGACAGPGLFCFALILDKYYATRGLNISFFEWLTTCLSKKKRLLIHLLTFLNNIRKFQHQAPYVLMYCNAALSPEGGTITLFQSCMLLQSAPYSMKLVLSYSPQSLSPECPFYGPQSSMFLFTYLHCLWKLGICPCVCVRALCPGCGWDRLLGWCGALLGGFISRRFTFWWDLSFWVIRWRG